jgi:uncharacterized protein
LKIITAIINFVLVIPIRIYQVVLSPWLPNACRYEPTCSHYTVDALKKHGPMKGLFLGTRRILSCHRWGGFGWDPVPEKDKFTWKKPEAQKHRDFFEEENHH